MGKIKVLIADDHAIVRIGLRSVFGYESDIEVVAEANNGIEAVREAERTRPDVAVVDLVMPRKDGVATTREILAAVPSAKVLILTTFGTSDGIAHALDGFLFVGFDGAVSPQHRGGAQIHRQENADGQAQISLFIGFQAGCGHLIHGEAFHTDASLL